MNTANKTIAIVMHYDGELAKDMVSRGWEPVLYVLIGKRGGCTHAWKSAKTGEYVAV